VFVFVPGSNLLLGGSSSSTSGTDSSKNATYINLYLTVQPALSVPDPVKEKLDCDESDDLVQHCERWRKDLETKYPHRKVGLQLLLWKDFSFYGFIRFLTPFQDPIQRS
jgi:hypothetical protein